MDRQTFQNMVVINDQPPRTTPPCRNRTFADGKIFVRNDFRRIHHHFRTDAVTQRTRTVGAVEREVSRFQFGEGNAALVTGKMFADMFFDPFAVPGIMIRVRGIFREDDQIPAAFFQCRFHRIVQTGRIDLSRDQTIHHRFDGMAFCACQRLEVVILQ